MTPSPSPTPFNSAHFRARIVKILLAAGAVATTISLLVEAISFAFPPLANEQDVGENPIGAVMTLFTAAVAILDFFIYLVTIVFFLMWLYRSYDNVRKFNPWNRTTYSPGFAVGSFFIPFMNLVVPYRIVKEIWQKSGLPEEVQLAEPSPPGVFPAWWLFWLLAGFTNNLSMRVSFNERLENSGVAILSIVASALSVLAAIFAYLVVDEIDKRQEETSARLNLGNFTTLPPPPPDLSMPITHFE